MSTRRRFAVTYQQCDSSGLSDSGGSEPKRFSRRFIRYFTPTSTKADPSKRPAKNLLDRDFTASRPNQKWVIDITYLPTATGWVYLAVVLDLFSRKIAGWSMSDSLATPLVSKALRSAIESRQPNAVN